MKSEIEDQGLGVDAGVMSPGSSVVVRVPYIIDLPHEGFNPSITRWLGEVADGVAERMVFGAALAG